MTDMRILGIETSCDETAAAVVLNGTRVLSSVVSTQIDLHARFGGVVPEVASRAHVEMLTPVVSQAMLEAGMVDGGKVDAVAATVGPGLIGSLLVGVSAAKALALVWDVPFVAVNHLEAHLYAAFLEEPDLELPLVVLLVSGGHTMLVCMEGHGQYRLLGQTVDDAAGEAFDKVAKLLGLPYPGGLEIDRLAEKGDPKRYEFPRSMLHSGDFQFSFSGLKTAVRYQLERETGELNLPDLCASFREAAVDILVAKSLRAAREEGIPRIAVSGGVSANSRLQTKLRDAAERADVEVCFAESRLRTDNAAMIAYVAALAADARLTSPLDQDVCPALARDADFFQNNKNKSLQMALRGS